MRPWMKYETCFLADVIMSSCTEWSCNKGILLRIEGSRCWQWEVFFHPVIIKYSPNLWPFWYLFARLNLFRSVSFLEEPKTRHSHTCCLRRADQNQFCKLSDLPVQLACCQASPQRHVAANVRHTGSKDIIFFCKAALEPIGLLACPLSSSFSNGTLP